MHANAATLDASELQPGAILPENTAAAIPIRTVYPHMGEADAPSRGASKARQLKLLLKKNYYVSKRNLFATTVISPASLVCNP